jgi:hypothetical protein
MVTHLAGLKYRAAVQKSSFLHTVIIWITVTRTVGLFLNVLSVLELFGKETDIYSIRVHIVMLSLYVWSQNLKKQKLNFTCQFISDIFRISCIITASYQNPTLTTGYPLFPPKILKSIM